jgi:hypothetical protein
MVSRRRASTLMAVALGVVALGSGTGLTLAMLTTSATSGANTFTTAASFDAVAPTVSATVVAKAGQYFASFVRQVGTYYVYANASDGGAAPSGIATIKADLGAITTGATAVTLVAGSFAVEGVAYGYRSALQTADNPLGAGSKSYSLISTDNVGNSRLQGGFAVTVDNTAPTGTDIQTANGGATVGKLEIGDTITYTFSEIIDPESIMTGWTGASTSVVVRFSNSASNDSFAIWNAANATQLNLGSVNAHGNFVAGAVTAGASGTASTMVLSNATNKITITLGTLAGTLKTDASNNTVTWTPSAGAFDRAGNPMSTGVVNETGTADPDF